MKITRTYLKEVIKEELQKLEEVDTAIILNPEETNYYNSLLSVIRAGDRNSIKKAKDELRGNKMINASKILQKINLDFPNTASL